MKQRQKRDRTRKLSLEETREIERNKRKAAKIGWNNRMRRLYDDFTPRKYAMTTYRMNHPQH